MFKTLSLAAIVIVLLQSCAGNIKQPPTTSQVDTVAAEVAQIEKDVDATKGKLLDIQSSTLKELDSLQQLLKQPDVIAKMGKEQYESFKKKVSSRLSDIGKISQLETLDKQYTTLVEELKQSTLDEATRKQKLEELKKASITFKDSITAILGRIKIN